MQAACRAVNLRENRAKNQGGMAMLGGLRAGNVLWRFCFFFLLLRWDKCTTWSMEAYGRSSVIGIMEFYQDEYEYL